MERGSAIRVIASWFGLLAVAGMVLLAVSQQKTISRLRDRERRDAAELERLRAETRDVLRLRAQESEIAGLRENTRDLLRLRSEVRHLRDQEQQSEVLQAANTRLLELIETFPLSSNQEAVVAAVRKRGAVLGIYPRSANDAPGGGVIVAGIDPNSPVARSDLKVGDQIIRLDGRPIETVAQLQIEMLDKKPGDIVRLDVVRNGAVIQIPVNTRAWPQQGFLP
jgi:C-terminal processing protease CtpA/Prc